MHFPVFLADRIQLAALAEVHDLLARAFGPPLKIGHEVVTVEMHLPGLTVGLVPFLELLYDVGSPAAASKVGIQSSCEMISLKTVPGLMVPGQRTTRERGNRPPRWCPFLHGTA